MSADKLQKEDLKKLEDEAYFELCQIVAEAMQFQDMEYLNAMIAYWKNKYKKLLDNPSPNFKKRIEYLLNQYYSKVTEYILSQIKLKEKKVIENQRKALNKLYQIIKDTTDLETLKQLVKKWKSKYPYENFLKMYQKRIDSATREKNLQENAFNQDEAFRDLYYDVVNRNGTIDELKDYLKLWEEKYSINNKFTIDDFIRHQSEVKRYVSDEYLQSIAKEVNSINFDRTPKPNVKPSSPEHLKLQQKAYAKLLHISKGSKNITTMFKWVYEHCHIQFNKEYKSLILNAIDLDYSPKYLKHIKPPKINLNNTSLSYEEHANIEKIKEYSIISYFNLLVTSEASISNNYFNQCVESVYKKVEHSMHSSVKSEALENDKLPVVEYNSVPKVAHLEDVSLDISTIINNDSHTEIPINITTNLDSKMDSYINQEAETFTIPQSEEAEVSILENIEEDTKKDFAENSRKDIVEDVVENSRKDIVENTEEKPLTTEQIVVVSPLLFSVLNHKAKQAEVINTIDKHVDKYALSIEPLEINKQKVE